MLDNLLAVAVDKEEMNKFQTKISWIFFSLSIYNVSKDSHWNKKIHSTNRETIDTIF